ncbi:MAG TPA: hypothetical protein VHB79_07475 [Polyangiaceae bacterium]|nr:hypothetical protein [Polyangiaceae bacterium]
MGSPFDTECPKCGKRAPIVLRGLESRCAACGAPRFLLGAPTVSLAGQPSRWGGAAASLAGLVVLVLGLSGSAGVWFLLQSIWPTHAFGWALAVPMVAASLLFGSLLLFGGRRLRQSGEQRAQQVQLQAVKSLVEHRRAPLTAQEVAQALDLPEPEADVLLTRLARETATDVTVDVDAQGRVAYDFQGEERRWRVLDEQAADEEATAAPAEQRRHRQ